MASERKSSKWVMLSVMGLMVLAMAGAGLSGLVSASQSTSAITVGETKIEVADYAQSYQQAINNISSQQNRQISSADARLMGLPDQVNQRLVQMASLSEIARRGNIKISDPKMVSEIAGYKAFQDPTGKIDPKSFQLYLSTNGITEREFVRKLSNQVTQDLVVEALIHVTPDTPALKDELVKSLGEKRSVVYVEFDANNLPKETNVATDVEVKKYYEDNTKNYLANPVRTIDIAYLVPERSKVNDAELKTIYDENLDRYTSPASVDEYFTLSFASEAEAAKVTDLDGLKAIAKERGLAEADYKFTNSPMSSLPSALVKLINETGKGFYPSVKSDLGYSVYQISSVTPSKTQSFEEAKNEIADGIAFDALQEKLSTVQGTVLDLAAGGVEPSVLAKETGLNFKTITLGKDVIEGLTTDQVFAAEALKAPVGDDREVINLSNGGIVYLRVKSEEPAKVLGFEEVKSKVFADFTALKKQTQLDAFHEKLMSEIKGGRTLEAISDTHGLKLTNSPLLRQQEGRNNLPLPIAFDFFNKKLGEVWDTKEMSKNYIIRLDKSAPFDPKDTSNTEFIKQSNGEVDAQLGDELVDDVTKSIATELGATMNVKLIEQVVGVDEQ